METAFVTGATGFVGRNLVELLVSRRVRVVALHRAGSHVEELSRLPIDLVRGVMHDETNLAPLIPQGVDAVFHVAANTSLWKGVELEQYRDNVLGTRALCRAALARRALRFVHVSSQAAYAHHSGTIDERAPQRGGESHIGYERTKFQAEEEVRAAVKQGLAAVILNPAHVLGPFDKGNWSRILRMIDQGTLPGVPGGAGSFCDAREIAKALVAAAERGGVGENYLLGGVDTSFLELVTIAGRLLGKRVPKRPTPAPLLRAFAAAQEARALFTGKEPEVTLAGVSHVTASYFVDCGKARRELGYGVTPLEPLLRDTIDWLRGAGLVGGAGPR